MRKKLLVIIALGGALAITAAGSASSVSVGTDGLTVTAPETGGSPLAQCADLSDNDGDGLVDLADPGCSGPTDDDEYNAPTGGSGGSDGSGGSGGGGGGTTTSGTTSTTTTTSGSSAGKKGKTGAAT